MVNSSSSDFAGGAARATTIAILTDEASGAKAKDLIALMKKTPPFSRMPDLQLKLVVKTRLNCAIKTGADAPESEEDANALPKSCQIAAAAQKTKAKNSKGAPASLKRLRWVDCSDQLAQVQAEANADNMIFVKQDENYGGSGGDYAMMTTNSPTEVGLHEFMHQIGFADEYAYENACEADMFCGGETQSGNRDFTADASTSFNVAVFKSRPPYASDAEARERHSGQIPWYAQIKNSTKIVNGSNLGTPRGGVVGLFPGQTCTKASVKTQTWVPGKEVTLLRSVSTNYIPEEYWGQISDALGVKISSTPGDDEQICSHWRDDKNKIQTECMTPESDSLSANLAPGVQ